MKYNLVKHNLVSKNKISVECVHEQKSKIVNSYYRGDLCHSRQKYLDIEKHWEHEAAQYVV